MRAEARSYRTSVLGPDISCGSEYSVREITEESIADTKWLGRPKNARTAAFPRVSDPEPMWTLSVYSQL